MNRCTCIDKPINSVFMSVLNYGAFIARVDVYYCYRGKMYKFINRCLSVLQMFKVNIPCEATNIHLYAHVNDIFEGCYLLFHKEYSVADYKCFLLWGLSFIAGYKQIPCEVPGIIKSILPPAIIVPQAVLCDQNILKNYNITLNNNCNNCCNNNDSNIEVINVEGQNIYD